MVPAPPLPSPLLPRPHRRPVVAVVGPFDRHNYGDLLFPLIVEHMVRRLGLDLRLEYYATVRATMSAHGSVDARSMRQLFARAADGPELVLIAGGEVLPARWPEILGYLCRPTLARMIQRVSRLLGDRAAGLLLGRCMGSRAMLPFVLAPSDFDRPVRVRYNAVGGSHAGADSAFVRGMLRARLPESDYLAVRDRPTFELLQACGIAHARLVPDCAILVSRLYPPAQLRRQLGETARALLQRLAGGYVCVQAGAAHLAGQEDAFLRAVERIKRAAGLPVLVLALGRATGHADQRSQALLHQSGSAGSGSMPTVIADCDSVFDLMGLIAGARLYMGTSLHGAITAVSFGVPVLGLCPSRVPKLAAFLGTWLDEAAYGLAEIGQIEAAFDRVWARRPVLSGAQIAALQDLAQAHFEDLLALDAGDAA